MNYYILIYDLTPLKNTIDRDLIEYWGEEFITIGCSNKGFLQVLTEAGRFVDGYLMRIELKEKIEI